MDPHRLMHQDKADLIASIRLIRLGLWENAAILLGEVNVTMKRSDSNIRDIIVRVYWPDKEQINFQFYVDI